MRAQDGVYRLAGDEYAVIVREALGAEAARIAEVVRASVPVDVAGAAPLLPFRVTVSTGLAPVLAVGGAMRAYARADRLLYDAKRGGKDRVATEADEAVAFPVAQA